MARILCLDYGKKRTGLAVTDPFQIIATHLTTVETKELMSYLTEYITKEEVEGFVIGKPLTLKNELNEIYKDILKFHAELSLKFPTLYIKEIDERYSSKLATQSILLSGANKKTRQDKSLVDMVSAVILLQSYLELQSNTIQKF